MPLPGVGHYAPSDGMSTAQGIRADPIVRVDDSGRGQRIEAPNTISDEPAPRAYLQKAMKLSAEARPTGGVAGRVIRSAGQRQGRLVRRGATGYKLRSARRATLARSHRQWSADRLDARRKVGPTKGRRRQTRGA